MGVICGCLRFLVGWNVPGRISKVENRSRKSLDHLILTRSYLPQVTTGGS
jgi:hypothetical protein